MISETSSEGVVAATVAVVVVMVVVVGDSSAAVVDFFAATAADAVVKECHFSHLIMVRHSPLRNPRKVVYIKRH